MAGTEQNRDQRLAHRQDDAELLFIKFINVYGYIIQ